MRIRITNTLTSEQIIEITSLEELAFEKENLKNHVPLSNKFNFNKSFPCFYLGYEKNKLVAFLLTFIPTSFEAEILAFTHPNHRKRGYFHNLFDVAKNNLSQIGINNVLFVVENGASDALKVLNKLKIYALDHSEYKMYYRNENIEDIILPNSNNIKLEELTNKNKRIFANITKKCFPSSTDDDSFINASLSSKSCKGFITYLNSPSFEGKYSSLENNIPIGVFNLNYQGEYPSIYGAGLLPEYRGKGLGNSLINSAIIEGFKGTKSNQINLEVGSNNVIAFNLYRKCGFKVDSRIDYYFHKCN